MTLDLPLPDGGFVTVTLQPETVLAPELQQRYPQLHTWRVLSDDPLIVSGRAELTELGLHVMLLTADGERLYIQPQQQTTDPAARQYQSFSQRQQQAATTSRRFSCGAIDNAALSWQNSSTPDAAPATPVTAQRAGEQLHTYDIAMAATGEYTEYFGSVSGAYSAIVTTVNRINQIFERELSIKLRLVSGTETVFANPNTDPYTHGSSILMAEENQAVLDNLVGNNRYDLGHVLDANKNGGDGIAYVGTLCNGAYKAKGSTSTNIPQGDAFVVDYVAHELGHQLGATHTFNGTSQSCAGSQRIAETAYEPGSGSSIMSYAGLCGSDNLQNQVDPQFHAASIKQIRTLAHDGRAAVCASVSSLNNQLPSAHAGSDYTIPARTPFILSGSGSDADNDKLLYGWDQIDAGTAAPLGQDTGNNALIRSNPLSSSALRTVPDVNRLLSTLQTANGESLPNSSRALNFRLTVRDSKGQPVMMMSNSTCTIPVKALRC
ncbi:MAG: M12 family metallo-peptidase [Thiolinea sp.]